MVSVFVLTPKCPVLAHLQFSESWNCLARRAPGEVYRPVSSKQEISAPGAQVQTGPEKTEGQKFSGPLFQGGIVFLVIYYLSVSLSGWVPPRFSS